MVNYDYTFDIFSLSDNFYDDYSQDKYPELMRKDKRPYTCLLIQTEDFILAIPYRTDINIHNKNSYIFKDSNRSKSHRSGLDYQKIVIISNSDYLIPTGYSIDRDEYKETVANIKRIVDEAVKYIKKYISHYNIVSLNEREFNRAYKYSTLKYFHEELGIRVRTKSMKVFVTGINGQLGHDVMNELKKTGHEGIGSDLKCDDVSLDITDANAVMKTISDINPDAVVHCAAWTAVDAAEDEDKKPIVKAVNVDGTKNIAEACKSIDAKMLYLSTDYVFDGQGETPWKPDDNSYSPLNYYGETKLMGEQAISSILDKYFIVRIAWVFGINGNNFIKTMLKTAENHDEVRVVNDQIGTPTYTHDLARLLVDMIETNKYGYYHATNEGGYISWYDFCCEIYKQAGLDTKVIPVSTEEYGVSVAKRPFNSRLDKSKLDLEGFKHLPDWKDAIRRYLGEIL